MNATTFDKVSQYAMLNTLKSDYYAYRADPPHLRGTALPWSKTHEKIRLRSGELSLWSGQNSTGKSSFLGQVMGHLACVKQEVAILSLEMPWQTTLHKIVQQMTAKADPMSEDIDRFFEKITTLTISPHLGSISDMELYTWLNWGLEYGVQHFMIDSMTKIEGMLDGEGVHGRQGTLIGNLHSFALKNDVHIHLVAHEGKSDHGPHRYRIRGSSAISDQADNVFGFTVPANSVNEFGEKKDALLPDLFLHVDKMRHSPSPKQVYAFWHDPAGTMQFLPTRAKGSMRARV